MPGETELSPVGEEQAVVPQQQETVPLAELNALKAKNSELIAERRKDRDAVAAMRAELDAINEKTSAQKQTELVEQGKYQELWKQQSSEVSRLQEQITTLQQQLSEKDGAMQKEKIRAAAVAAFSQGGVQAPDHLFRLLGADMKLADDGSVAVLTSSGEVPLTDHVANLKEPGSGFDYFFSGSGAKGMGAVPSSAATSGQQNPYSSGNLSEAIRLEMENPALAQRLKAQAGK